MRLGGGKPFVLLDDARASGAQPARLYVEPVEVVRADTAAQVAPALERLRQRGGLHAAGFLSYEAGAALHPRLAPRPAAPPLLWFALFDRWEEVGAADVATLLPDPAGAWAGSPRPLAGFDYPAAFARVQALIEAGDIYQVNLSMPMEVPVAGHPLALYAALRGKAAAGHGGVVWTGEQWLLSFSPELFFSLHGDALAARPMKGTARRGDTPEQDAAGRLALCEDAKQRAENLMIVDLTRNDLSRVAVPGSVAVPELFAVESYPTVHQMVSTVTAQLAPALDAVDVLGALLPCGSITGAPKLRAMQVIAEVEPRGRGAYTGAIGRIDAGGDAEFNVAIRTLSLDDGADMAMLGLGSAVVADSDPAAEWDECLAKGAFVTAGSRPFDLIETMAFDPHDGIVALEAHLARLKGSADRFGFAFNRHAIRNELQAATFRLRMRMRVRLLLARSGAITVEVTAMPPAPAEPVEVALLPLPVDRHDFRLRHKTSDRRFHDRARRAAGTFEVLFVDPDGFVTEGSFTSLFVERGGVLVTPPLSRGLLPGVLRAGLLAHGKAVEGELRPEDLGRGLLIGNAVRGLIPATVAKAGRAGL